jgi:hypothetical protein
MSMPRFVSTKAIDDALGYAQASTILIKLGVASAALDAGD